MGNTSLKIRREYIKAYLALHNSLLKKVGTLGKPYQLWIELVDEDGGLDSVYIHTSNPNEDNFPNREYQLELSCRKIFQGFNKPERISYRTLEVEIK